MTRLAAAGRVEMNIDPRALDDTVLAPGLIDDPSQSAKRKLPPSTDPGMRESKRLFRQWLADSNPDVTRKGERS